MYQGNHDHHNCHHKELLGSAKKGKMTNNEWDEERRLFRKVLKTFKTYGHAKHKANRAIHTLENLSAGHQSLLSDYKDHLHSLRTLIDVNQNLFYLIVDSADNVYENQSEIYGCTSNGADDPQLQLEPTPPDYDKLNSVMKQLCRDWSVDGSKERLTSYQPIIDEIESQFKDTECKSDIKILVPGCGTGRLAHEIVRRGYDTQGNEFSMYMLFASNFVLNKCSEPGQYKIYPWIHESVNVLHHHHQLRPMTFPDVDPSDLPPDAKFSMTAGDFLEVYSAPEYFCAWNCIATCFFIDCAANVVSFIERIYGCLKEGGVWINLGPLLYHYADLPDEESIEPSYDFLVPIIKKIGFKLEKEVLQVPTTFGGNPNSMMSYSYKSVFFVCRKTTSTQSQIPSGIDTFSMRCRRDEAQGQGQMNGDYHS